MKKKIARHTTEHFFNTPIETGLRSVFVLAAIFPGACDLQRLVIYDYLLVHSGDVEGGPTSLHPPTPLRSGELLVRRNLVFHGLRLMQGKGLVEQEFTSEGFFYKATDVANPFLDYFQNPYALTCRKISRWLAEQVHILTDVQLRVYINSNIGRWGAEFTRESLLWEDIE
jgi:hypothetical protein